MIAPLDLVDAHEYQQTAEHVEQAPGAHGPRSKVLAELPSLVR